MTGGGRAGLALAAALAAGCGVDGRADLVGRYRTTDDGPRETWSLAPDGTCTIERHAPESGPRTLPCEWEWVEREGRATLVVTVLPPAGAAGTRHRTRYVLTPSRLWGGAVTIPLGGGSGRQLRKVE